MKSVLDRVLDEAFARVTPRPYLSCEDPLRVAAATLTQGQGNAISATTVVGVLGLDDVAEFQALVAQLSDEFELDARVRMHVGSFAVRFSRRVAPAGFRSARTLESAAGAGGLVGRAVRLVKRWL